MTKPSVTKMSTFDKQRLNKKSKSESKHIRRLKEAIPER